MQKLYKKQDKLINKPTQTKIQSNTNQHKQKYNQYKHQKNKAKIQTPKIQTPI